MPKNTQISLAILALIEEGLSLREAIDVVLGAGTFSALAGDLYDTLRSRG
ncbi:MAG: hypothetical protein ACRC56_11940 [Bosea sp. (in: a-proteobacteria)]